jgi:hypothetical protein
VQVNRPAVLHNALLSLQATAAESAIMLYKM